MTPPTPPRPAYTRAYIGAGFHIGNITATLCSGGLWLPIYLLWWWRKRRPRTVTTHER